jgi:hypothetical protein
MRQEGIENFASSVEIDQAKMRIVDTPKLTMALRPGARE